MYVAQQAGRRSRAIDCAGPDNHPTKHQAVGNFSALRDLDQCRRGACFVFTSCVLVRRTGVIRWDQPACRDA